MKYEVRSFIMDFTNNYIPKNVMQLDVFSNAKCKLKSGNFVLRNIQIQFVRVQLHEFKIVLVTSREALL